MQYDWLSLYDDKHYMKHYVSCNHQGYRDSTAPPASNQLQKQTHTHTALNNTVRVNCEQYEIFSVTLYTEMRKQYIM